MNQVLNVIDINNNGYITTNVKKMNYNIKNQPDVINGRKSSPEIETEILDNNDYFQLLITSKLRKGKISIQEFAIFMI